ncbi:nuclear transport factor 2 family protein [Streptosporangium sp. NPDC051022]|uniref:nuclear transport factor 2 family protein n=1 Tax=Streptosporangium sp. NPDC051022 TaxID=3155752 RepID=UPI00342DD736
MTTTDETVSVTFDGGDDEAREALVELHHRFLRANDHLDYEALTQAWDDTPTNRSFNTNGFTYENLADWENIWNFYRPKFKLLGPYSPGRLHIIIRGDMACLSADYVSRDKAWVGDGEVHNPPYYRATQVAVRSADGWKVVHAHFSVQGEGERPDLADR